MLGWLAHVAAFEEILTLAVPTGTAEPYVPAQAPRAADRPVQGLLNRVELHATLDRMSARQVTIVSAPAGSGKTSMLKAWASRSAQRVAFVSLERDRADGQTFWRSLLSAVVPPASNGRRPKRGADTPFDADAAIDRIVERINGRPEPIVLIIDDLHELASAETLSQLERLVTGLPPWAHAILSSRRDPSLRLHRLRLAGEVGEIRARDLMFTESETGELLRVSGVALSEEGAAALWRRTEGWAAGLRLAAISLAGHPDPDGFVDEFSGGDRAVSEYLLAEMLERQPEETQRMLLRTSLVPRLNGELADLLAGRSDSERILLDLEDANAFVVSLDPQRNWFRYHQLLADFLRLELRRTLPEEVPALHRRAAAWFADHGHVLDAARHLLAAGDWPEAARVLADRLLDLALDGQQDSIVPLLGSFPPGASADNPDLALAHAASELAQGRLEEGAAHLALAEAQLPDVPADRRQRIEAVIEFFRLALARRSGRFSEVTERAERLGSSALGEAAGLALEGDLRGATLMNLGVAEMWSGDLRQAERHLAEGAELAQRTGHAYLELACRSHLAFASKLNSFTVARERSREAIALAERNGWDERSLLAPALATLAGTSIWMGEFDEGEVWLRRAWKAVEQNLDPANGLLLHLVAAMLHAGRDEQQSSLEQLRLAAEAGAQLKGEHVLGRLLTAWLASAHARNGRPQEARVLLDAVPPASREDAEIRVARAVTSLAEGEPEAALNEVQPVRDGTNAVLHAFTPVEANLLAGLANLDLGRRREATVAAEVALAAAEPDRLVLPFVVTGAMRLLEIVPPHDTAHRALLIELRDLLGGAPVSRKRPDRTVAPDPLSPSELRVLRYLPTNLTRPEIARELYVSVNTVNTHIRNIYSKLGASGRSSAVESARDLKLLAGGRAR